MSKGSSENRGSSSHRLPRVEREIREVIGLYLLSGFKGELPGIVSVSRVICSKDFRTAKVLFTLMNFGANIDPGSAADDDEYRKLLAQKKADQKAAAVALQEHAHEVQHEVNRKLRMKHCPKITFHYDEGVDHAMKVESILRDLNVPKSNSEGTVRSNEDQNDDLNLDDE